MFALLSLWLAGSASAQVTPIPQFVGEWQEGWEAAAGVTCVPVAGGAVGDVCSGAMIVTSSWSFMCSLFPNSGNAFVGSAAGVATYTFATPMHRFGGWFNTNADDGTGWEVVITFYDTNGVQLDQTITPITNCGSWVWLGYESVTPLGSVTVDGTQWGGGFAMMDDMEFSAVPTNDADADGLNVADGDCDDFDANVYPGAAEICDGKDSDCDGYLPPTEFDADFDGSPACLDCDDGDPTTYPGAIELCDGEDHDCDGVLDSPAPDDDNDGVGTCEGDCDDRDPTVRPGATEVCDGLDNDCDGVLPPDEVDSDGDNALECQDCDDNNDAVRPGAQETCDGLDNNCDGVIDPRELDEDGDGLEQCNGDCDDADPARSPEFSESCDGIDNDCDGEIDPVELDGDGDTVPSCDDCDDEDDAIFPGATDVADDGIDQDCDGADAIAEVIDDPTLDDGTTKTGGCGCSSARGSAGLAPWLAVAALVGRRRIARR